MTRWLIAGAAALAMPFAAAAQEMDHSKMPGMKMPAKPQPKPQAKPQSKPKSTPKPKPATRSPATKAPAAKPQPDPHASHTMPAAQPQKPAAPTDPHAGHTMPAAPRPGEAAAAGPQAGHQMPQMPAGEMTKPAGDAPPPDPPRDFAADRIFPSGEMAAARAALRREHGGSTVTMIFFNLAEYQVRKRRDGYRWDGEAWVGGDLNRLVVKSEGEGAWGRSVEEAEVQLLYSRAIAPYFDIQAGVRYDIRPSRAYATIGFEGLAPYWFEVEGALFLSDKGDLLARLEGYYDQRMTQRLILQPRAEFNFAAQDVPETRTGSGLSDIELGLRLRYEIRREFAPYIGVSWARKFGDSARFARADGERAAATSLVLGIRAFF